MYSLRIAMRQYVTIPHNENQFIPNERRYLMVKLHCSYKCSRPKTPQAPRDKRRGAPSDEAGETMFLQLDFCQEAGWHKRLSAIAWENHAMPDDKST